MASTIATILCGIGTLEVYGIGYKLFLAVETGIFITAGTLPLIVLVVFFSKTYVFSILLCVFYSVLNMSATALFDTLPKTMLWLLPTPLTTFWSAGDMAAHGIKNGLGANDSANSLNISSCIHSWDYGIRFVLTD